MNSAPEIILLIMSAVMMAPTSAVEPVGADMHKESSMHLGLMEIKSILTSVQGSLITSVSLIQDQMDQFGKLYISSFDQRLAKIESKLNQMDVDLKDVKEKGKAWDTFRDHASSWAELMTSVDSKVDHLSMSQTDQLISISGQLSSLQTALGEGMEKISQRVTYLENQVRSGREETQADVIIVMRNIEAKLTEIAFNGHANGPAMGSSKHGSTTPPCIELKDIVKRSANKVDSIFAILAEEHAVKESQPDEGDIGYPSGNPELAKEEEEEEEARLRKVLLPIQKGLRRLKEMKHLHHKLDSAVSEVSRVVKNAANDIDRRFNDFLNMTMEMFEHQHTQLEAHEHNLEGLKQCCTETSSDLRHFQMKTDSSLAKMDAFTSRKLEDSSDDGCSQQLQLDADRIISVVRDQGKLILDDLLRCSEYNHSIQNVVENEDSSESNSLESERILDDKDASRLTFKTCEEDLANAGLTDTKGYTLEIDGELLDDKGQAFRRRRLCDQDVAGGAIRGWTLSLNSSCLLLAFISSYLAITLPSGFLSS